MGRPRLPAQVLELRGAFAAHPERRREDAPGAGPFDLSPPAGLTGEEIGAWRWVIERLPRLALTSTEEMGVYQMARLKAACDRTHPSSPDFKKLDDSLRQWAVQMGMTLQARTKLGTGGDTKPKNKFADLAADGQR